MRPEKAADTDYKDYTISEVEDDGRYWIVRTAPESVLSFLVDKIHLKGVPLKKGDHLRLYGMKCNRIRGIDLNGEELYYRTEEEDGQKRIEDMYGRTAAELVKRWDSGEAIWSLEMGGIGPGYEQALQVAMVEILRAFSDRPLLEDIKELDRLMDEVLNAADKDNALGGLSGAQAGTAKRLAYAFLKQPPWKTVLEWKKQGLDKRLILVSSFWPRAATAPAPAAAAR